MYLLKGSPCINIDKMKMKVAGFCITSFLKLQSGNKYCYRPLHTNCHKSTLPDLPFLEHAVVLRFLPPFQVANATFCQESRCLEAKIIFAEKSFLFRTKDLIFSPVDFAMTEIRVQKSTKPSSGQSFFLAKPSSNFLKTRAWLSHG